MSKKKFWALAIPLAFLAGLALFLLGAGTGGRTSSQAASVKAGGMGLGYEFASLERGTIESLVAASGTLEPVSTVMVLARMSGRAEAVYADYNDRVKKDQVLVALDTSTLALQRKQSEASVRKARANAELSRLNYGNQQALAAKGLLSDYELASARTSLSVAEAELAQAEAALEIIDTELGSYALVRSPIDGIVLERSVDVGQTVVEGSSSNSSSLFTLAEDLKRMEIEAEVDELDIASVEVGQEVRFSVDAMPGRKFQGKVRQLRLVPATTNNVVNYTVIVDAENPEGSLLPGMTASLEFIKDKRENVLTIPNAALRFSPTGLSAVERARRIFQAGLAELPAEQKAAALEKYDAALAEAAVKAEAAAKEQSGNSTAAAGSGGLAGLVSPQGPGPGAAGGRMIFLGGGQTGSRRSAASDTGSKNQSLVQRKPLWYLDEAGELRAIMVTVGSSDGTRTEVSGPGVLEGRKVILKLRTE